MLAVFAGSANAVLTLSNPTIGGTSQERGSNASATLTLTNNETSIANVSSITFTAITADSAAERAYTQTITFSNTTPAVPVSGSTSVSVTGLVPADFDGVDTNFDAVAFKIGTITVTYTGGATVTTNLLMQAENGLQFDKVKITVGESTDTVEDGDSVDELKPGDLLDIEVSAESKYDEDDWDYDIENVEITAEIDDSDFDLDEDEDLSDLSPSDSDSVTFSNIAVDTEADGNYDLVITLSGTDENGAMHGESMVVELKVERETHELVITKAQLTKPTVKCVDGEFEKTDVKVSVLNTGKRDEEDAIIESTIADLELQALKDSITIDKDDAGTYTFSLQVPEGTEAGIYDVDVVAYARPDVETDRETLSLTVEACSATATTATATTGTAATATTGTTATATAPTARITSKTPFTETNTYMYVLGGVVVVLLGSTIWIGIKLAALAK